MRIDNFVIFLSCSEKTELPFWVFEHSAKLKLLFEQTSIHSFGWVISPEGSQDIYSILKSALKSKKTKFVANVPVGPKSAPR